MSMSKQSNEREAFNNLPVEVFLFNNLPVDENIGSWSKSLLLALLLPIRLPDNHSSTQKQKLITIELSRCFEREEKNIFRPA